MNKRTAKRRPLPVGVSNFEKICRQGYCYVDKTLFIKEVLDAGTEVTLITRPRRFGKTLNMDMLQVFFEKTDEDTSRYFTDKKIWEEGREYTGRQGRYPVISVSFMHVGAESWERSYEKMRDALQDEYERQLKKLDQNAFDPWDLERMMGFIRGEPDRTTVESSLQRLSRILHAAYGVAPIILIDEYDTPIEAAWASKNMAYYNNMVAFMRGLLSPALKDNDHLSFACLTGVLRVAKEGLFSGLNNLKVDGVLDKRYDECFGFTPDEVRALVAAYGLNEEKYEEIRHWYEGYRFGDEEVFNPWSVLMYLDDDCVAKAYWANTSGKAALGEVLLRGSAEFLEGLSSLLAGEKVWSTVGDSLVYPDLVRGNAAEAAYTLLLMSGYLTATGRTRMLGGRREWELAIPNRELEDVYPWEILASMTDQFNSTLCRTVQDAVRGGRAKELEDALSKLLMQSVSFFDLESEKEYQTWLLGLLASMSGYRLTSNREAGEERYDICLRPMDSRHPGVLIEVKHAKNKDTPEEKMREVAAKAIRQIRKHRYAEELRAENVGTILEFGVAFCGKTAYVATGDEVPETEE